MRVSRVDHYENFPVASVLLPRKLRAAVVELYAFMRRADDLADEGVLPPEARLDALDRLAQDLDRLAAGKRPEDPQIERLGHVLVRHGLPLAPLYDLLSAFRQDVEKTRYAHFGEVMDYCRRSAVPVGRLLLALYGVADRRLVAHSDSLCAALQIVNFLQDIGPDYARGRIYLPQDELARFHIDEAQIARGDTGGTWWPFMRLQIERARKLLQGGAPLGRLLPGRLGLETRLVVLGGEAVLRKIHAARGDVFTRPLRLERRDWPRIWLRAFFSALARR